MLPAKIPSLFLTLGPGALSGQIFAALCDQLLIRDSGTRNLDFWTPSDRAGDYRGLDSFLHTRGSSFEGFQGMIGFQYKFFGSETTPLSRQQKQSVLDSLRDAARKNPEMSVWILVTPEDFNSQQLSWFQGLLPPLADEIERELGRESSLEIRHWGHKRLTSLMLRYPECAAHIYPFLVQEKSHADWRGYCSKLAEIYPEDPSRVSLETEDGRKLTGALADFADSGEQNLLCVLGSYGAGKTTSLEALSGRLARRYLAEGGLIPVLVKLRYVRGSSSFRHNLMHYLRTEYALDLDVLEMRAQLGSGRLLLIFDGLDEKEGSSQRAQARIRLAEVFDFVSRTGKVIVSSRTEFFLDALDERQALLGRQRIEALRIRKLGATASEQHVVESLDRSAKIVYLAPIRAEDAHECLRRMLGSRYVAARAALMATYDIPDLITTPLFLNLVAETIPEIMETGHRVSAVDVYTYYVHRKLEEDVLSGRIDSRPEVRLDEIERLAEYMLMRSVHRIHYSQIPATVLQRDVGPDRDFLSTAFLVRDASGSYEFSHRSFLEYFGARRMYRFLRCQVARTSLWSILERCSGKQMGFLREMIHQAFQDPTGHPGDPGDRAGGEVGSGSRPVRAEQYAAFLETTGYSPMVPPEEALGFALVSYYDAVAFVLWANSALPTRERLISIVRPRLAAPRSEEDAHLCDTPERETVFDAHPRICTEVVHGDTVVLCGYPEWCLDHFLLSAGSSDPEHPREILQCSLSIILATSRLACFRCLPREADR